MIRFISILENSFSSPTFGEQPLDIYGRKWQVQDMMSQNLFSGNSEQTTVSSKSFVNIRNLILPGHDLSSPSKFNFLKTSQCEEKTNTN